MKTAFLFVALSALPLWAEASKADHAAAIPSQLTLTDCVHLAVEHNPDLRNASEAFLASEGKIIKLRSVLYPTAQTQVISTPLTFYVQINQVLYSHQTMPRIRESRLEREQVFINYRQTLNEVIFQVRQAFTAVISAEAQWKLLRDYAQQESQVVGKAQQLFEAGKAQRSEVLNVQVKANLAHQNQTLAELTLEQARLQLQGVLGLELPAHTGFQGSVEKFKVPEHLDVPALTDEAMRNRPDLKLLASLQLSGEEQIQISVNNAYPVVGFSSNSAIQPPALGPSSSFDLQRNDSEPATQRAAGNTQLPLSLYTNWTIYDGGKLEGIKASGEAQLASQQTALNQLRTSIPGEINGAVATILNEQQTLRTIAGEQKPEELRKSAHLDYEAGRIRQLDLANLEDDILQQEQLRLAAETRLSLALAALDHALGRTLEIAPPKPSP